MTNQIEFCAVCSGFTNHRWEIERDADEKSFDLICMRCAEEDDYFQTMQDYLDSNLTKLEQEVQKMVNVTEYTKPAGSYMTGKDVIATPNAIFVITTEGEMETSEKFGNEKLTIEGEYNQMPKKLSLSKTNARTVAKALGEDSKKWIGHKLVLETYKTKTSDGKMVDAINVKSVE